jgi:hypothetical protein
MHPTANTWPHFILSQNKGFVDLFAHKSYQPAFLIPFYTMACPNNDNSFPFKLYNIVVSSTEECAESAAIAWFH